MSSAFEPLYVPVSPSSARPFANLAMFAPPLDAPPALPDGEAEDALARLRETEDEALRADAFDAGHAAGMAAALLSDAAAVNLALRRLPAVLDALGEVARLTWDAAARDLAATVFAALDAALPGIAEARAADSAATLAARLKPLLEQGFVIALRAAPHLAEAIAARLADPRISVAEDPDIPAGDLVASWQGGRAQLDLAARRAAIRSALADAGLLLKD
jgi:hypothetical protein